MSQEGGVCGIPGGEGKSKTDEPFSDIDISGDEFSVTIYPNPAEDYFNLDVNTSSGDDIYFSIYDATGSLQSFIISVSNENR